MDMPRVWACFWLGSKFLTLSEGGLPIRLRLLSVLKALGGLAIKKPVTGVVGNGKGIDAAGAAVGFFLLQDKTSCSRLVLQSSCLAVVLRLHNTRCRVASQDVLRQLWLFFF